ncbi:MAG: membrane-anchored protein YejM (alkaline phosphatase superfamily), partial [Planctomycetota bacterium]
MATPQKTQASPKVAASFDAGCRREAAFIMWLVNLALGISLGANWLVHLPEVDSARLWLFALGALVSSVLTLTLLPGLIGVGIAHLTPRVRAFGFVQAFCWTIFQVLVFADTRVYNMFQYHFNGQVLNLVYTRGSEDSINLGWQVWTAIGGGFALVGSLQFLLWNWLLGRAKCRRTAHNPRRMLLRPTVVFGMVLLPTVFIEKTMYAQADLSRDHEITALARLFPLYTRLPMEDFASRVLGVEVLKPPVIELEGVELDYPHAMPMLDPEGARPNVLILVVDCLRQDILDQETMPNVTEWSEDARIFDDHVSGGNSTRFGIFSLIYSLHGSYWFPFLQERRSPVLIDVLAEADYQFGIFGAASMNYPELRDTTWASIPESVHDQFPSIESWRRDREAGAAMIEWLGERAEDEEQRPFFGFALLDSPHQTYSYPPELEHFTPAAPEIDYMAMTRNEGPEPEMLAAVRNRYRNAVLHADQVLGVILAQLDQLGLGENTIVIVTGDHGEEFYENGFIGHTSAYTPEQVAVPFLVRGPGFEPGHEPGPTSHLDFAPTLLELMGASPEMRGDWALGESLLDPQPDRRRVMSGWNELGMWAEDEVIRV